MLIISPKTYSGFRAALLGELNAYKIDPDFWFNNFKDFSYCCEINGRKVSIILTGYGQLSIAAGLREYDRLLREGPDDSVFFVGSCVNTIQSDTDVNDIILPTRSDSDDRLPTEIADMAIKRGCKDPWSYDSDLRKMCKEAARRLSIPLKEGAIFSQDTILSERLRPFTTEWGFGKGYIGCEYESAAFSSYSNFLGLKPASLMFVKDTRKHGDYRVATEEQIMQDVSSIIKIIKMAIAENGCKNEN